MNKESYDASKITVLKGLEAVRKRPGMYIGDLTEAYRRMILEVVDNSVDEYMAGHGDQVYIVITDKYCSVKDNGRGIPIDNHSSGMSGVEVVMTTLHAGGKFNNDNYIYSGGLHGVGVSVTNALSDWLEVEVYKNHQIYHMRFEKGIAVTPLVNKGYTAELSGTKVTFYPDFSIVEEKYLNILPLTSFLKKLSLLNEGLKITLENNGEKEGPYPSSLVEFYKGKFLHDPIFLQNDNVRVCFGWENNKKASVACFTNNIEQTEGGNHLSGFRSAVTRALSSYLGANFKKSAEIESEDIHAGIQGILSIRIKEPKFSSQTKNKLVSTEARSIVEQFVSEALKSWLEENPKCAQIIMKKIISTYEDRLLIEKARDSMKKLTNNAHNLLPGKLIDCRTDDIKLRELFIVEGNSAGGSGGAGRDAETQAILPTKGKVINVFRQPDYKSLGNAEIMSIIATIGTGIGENFDIQKLRYNKIIILTDADQDGNHIFALLLTCFMKFFPQLIKDGHIYRGFAPLYKLQIGKNKRYIRDEKELQDFLIDRLLSKKKIIIREKEANAETLINVQKYCEAVNKNTPKCEGDYSVIKWVVLLHDTADLVRLKQILEEVLNCQILVSKNDDSVEVKVLSLFEKQNYKIPIQQLENHFFPIKVDNKIFYDPINFTLFLEKTLYEDIDIQRYKGLGEMNADQLSETTLDPSNRNMIRLKPETEEEFLDLQKRLIEIMGDESPRRSLVLGYLGLEEYSNVIEHEESEDVR